MRRSDGSRIKYKRVAAADGEEVPYAEIAKGFELPTGETVVLTDEDFADLPLTTQKTVDVLQFVPLERGRPDLLLPVVLPRAGQDRRSSRTCCCARRSPKSGRVAIVKVALRQRESLACLRVRDGVLVLETMLWPDEIREADFAVLDEDVEVKPAEVKMAQSLIEALSGDFDPTQFTDEYRAALESLIEAKAEGHAVVAPAAAEADSGTVVDLMAALRASVEAAKKARKAGADEAAAG